MKHALACFVLLGAAPVAALEPHFDPIAFAVGHCWRAEFSNGMEDEQCFAAMHGGRLVHNTHVVHGSEPRYGGTTIYSWDVAQGRVRFHYFTSTGAVSEGHLVAHEDGYTVPERHVGADGSVTELESVFRRDGDDAFVVKTRQLKAEAWADIGERRYVRSERVPRAVEVGG
jgi:hypothetical protein